MKRVIEMLKDRVETLDRSMKEDRQYVEYLRELGRHDEAERVIARIEDRVSFSDEIHDAIERLEDET